MGRRPVPMMYENIIGGVVAIIGVAIILGVGTTILGGTSTSFDCKVVEGYNDGPADTDSTTAGQQKPAEGTPAAQANSIGWAKTCFDTNEQSRQAWLLIPVVLIVIAAVIILGVLRHFG